MPDHVDKLVPDVGPESQLMLLSRIVTGDFGHDIVRRKRTADGVVKDDNYPPVSVQTPDLDLRPDHYASPYRTHSRNTSTFSVASTTGSRISEVSAELKTRLSYAMVKVNHGWQSRSIGEVESLASQAGSPTSTVSTLPRRLCDSVSPPSASPPYLIPSVTATSETYASTHPSAFLATSAPVVPSSFASTPHQATHAATFHPKLEPRPANFTLAPPAPIVHNSALPASVPRGRSKSSPRRWDVQPSPFPEFASSGSPHTPVQPSFRAVGRATPSATPLLDPILYPATPNLREQDAIESLLFMRSPANSISLYTMSPSASPQAALLGPTPRRALPDAPVPPRRSTLPSNHLLYQAQRHTASALADQSRRRVHPGPTTDRRALALPLGLGPTPGQAVRPVLVDADIERMLDRVAGTADGDSSSDEDILLPVGRGDTARVISS